MPERDQSEPWLGPLPVMMTKEGTTYSSQTRLSGLEKVERHVCQVSLKHLHSHNSLFIDCIKKIIGQGAYGTVVDAVEVGGRCHVAIKVCRSTSWARSATLREVEACMVLKERDIKGTR